MGPRKARGDDEAKPAQPGVPGFLRARKSAILRSWEARVVGEEHEVALSELALRDDLPALLDELAAWLDTDAAPDASLLAESAFAHVIQRLDAGLALAQVFREYRLLREAIIEEVLSAESAQQESAGATERGRAVRVVELARLNAGLDVVLAQSIEHFVDERDRRAAAERARAAAVAHESETRYRALFDSIDEGFCVVEVLFDGERAVDCRFLEVNPAFERHSGLANATGKRVYELVPDHDGRSVEIYGRIARTREPARFETSLRGAGRVFEVFAFRFGAREQRQVAVLFYDVTPRKHAEERLRASDAWKAFLLKLSDALRPLADPTAIHETVTRSTREQFEADRCSFCEIEGDELIIRRDDARADLPPIAGVHRLTNVPLLKAAIDAGRPMVVVDVRTGDLEDVLRRRCLELRILAFVTVPVIKGGKAVGLLCLTQSTPRTWTDSEVAFAAETAERTWMAVEHAAALSALRHANARLIEADWRKNDFLAALSHELRNPLAPIRNSVYILERVPPGGDKAVRARQVIDRQTQHMARLIDDLLDVTRISRGKIVLQKERVDLNAIAKGAAEDHREMFARGGVDLEVVDAGRPVWVHGDRTRLAQVIDNLLTNAAKFTPREGKTVLTVAEAGGRAEVRVRDDGSGIAPETLQHLFEPFVQAAQTLERTRGGLGLGLALVKGLVELHSGTVTGHSEGEGRGAEFVVSLPLQAAAEEARPPASDSPLLRAKTRRVLVVEDNVDSAESLREALSLSGHEVMVAYSGSEGLEAARARSPDVILCDIGLPGMDGYEVARSIRADADARLRRALLVALSGYARPEDVVKSKEAGFDRHIAKPPNIDALEKLLHEAAARDT